jgi:hypothetical protein
MCPDCDPDCATVSFLIDSGMMMKILGKTGTCTLTLLLLALPTMVCLMPESGMTAAEHACCKYMAERCGDPSMTKSHPCCQRVSVSDRLDYAQTKSKQLGDHFLGIALHYLGTTSIPALALPHFSNFEALGNFHGPPDSPPSALSILRI